MAANHSLRDDVASVCAAVTAARGDVRGLVRRLDAVDTHLAEISTLLRRRLSTGEPGAAYAHASGKRARDLVFVTVADGVVAMRAHAARLREPVPPRVAANLAAAEAGTGERELGVAFKSCLQAFALAVEAARGGRDVAPRNGASLRSSRTLLQWLADLQVARGRPASSSHGAMRDARSHMSLRWASETGSLARRHVPDAHVAASLGIAELRAHAARLGVAIPTGEASALTAAEASRDVTAPDDALDRACRQFALALERDVCGGRAMAPRFVAGRGGGLRHASRLLNWMCLFRRAGDTLPVVAATAAALRAQSARLGVAIPRDALSALEDAEAMGFNVADAVTVATRALASAVADCLSDVQRRALLAACRGSRGGNEIAAAPPVVVRLLEGIAAPRRAT